ncbi:MAG: 1,4-alpha-glucan branching protein domain-containing protein [Gemmatimonadales bacterium]
MDFVLTLHSHLPYVLQHGRWPHGSDWLSEAAFDTYLPLLEVLDHLETEGVPSPVTLGITPILANQLSHPEFARELSAFLTQRLEACDEATDAFAAQGEEHLIPLAGFWRERIRRLRRRFERHGGDLARAFQAHAASGRIELLSSAATHGFLPLLGRDESIGLQLAVGRMEHRRLFGREPSGCWVPECAYRGGGPWQPDPAARPSGFRPGIEEHLAAHDYLYFFIDAHLAEAGRPLGLYREGAWPDGGSLVDEDALDTPSRRSPYRTYEVAPRPGRSSVVAFVRDPHSSRQVWSRHGGYPGDPGYLEFHKIRYPGGLKFWRVTHPAADLGLKEPYEHNTARARAWAHAGHFHWLLATLEASPRPDGETVIVAPFDTELFGHWWFEGVDFIGDLYRRLHRRGGPRTRTAGAHLREHPAEAAVALAEGSWGAEGDFRMWLNPSTRWTWERLWPLEDRFWAIAGEALRDPGREAVLAQAARELLLLQSSDWQFIISTGAAADYAATRFLGHAEDLTALLDTLDVGGDAAAGGALAERLRRRDDIFPGVLDAVAAVVTSSPAAVAG